MKKKKIIVLSIFLVGVIALVFVFTFFNNQDNNEERYAEIKESIKKGVEWHLRAAYPGCTITKQVEEVSTASPLDSSFLIRQGYIKKSDLLDVDNKSYCDVLGYIHTHFEDINDQQHNCEVTYKVFLKCKDYEDDGFDEVYDY